MKTKEIAPGSILQRLYIKERLRKLRLRSGLFLELGSGNGYNSRILLEHGLRGIGVDLNASACEKNKALNADFIQAGKYEVHNGDFFSLPLKEKFDLIFSCMVIEHMDNDLVERYFQHAKTILKPNGLIITMVPAQPKFWGIEDDVVGHKKRYTFNDFPDIAARFGFKLNNNSGLTFPVSNVLLPLSNRIIQKSESEKKNLSAQEQTVLSGNREVMYKTDYPWYLSLVLNDFTMYPFHVLQKLFARSSNSMIIYSELVLPG